MKGFLHTVPSVRLEDFDLGGSQGRRVVAPHPLDVAEQGEQVGIGRAGRQTTAQLTLGIRVPADRRQATGLAVRVGHSFLRFFRYLARSSYSPLSLANIATLRAVPNQVSVDGRTSRAAASMSCCEIIRT